MRRQGKSTIVSDVLLVGGFFGFFAAAAIMSVYGCALVASPEWPFGQADDPPPAAASAPVVRPPPLRLR